MGSESTIVVYGGIVGAMFGRIIRMNNSWNLIIDSINFRANYDDKTIKNILNNTLVPDSPTDFADDGCKYIFDIDKFDNYVLNDPSMTATLVTAYLREKYEHEPKYYNVSGYHTTNIENFDSIMGKGLVPGKESPSGQDWEGDWSGKGIYFHQNLPLHEVDQNEDGLFSVTIEFKVSMRPENLVPDEEFGSVEESVEVLEAGGPMVYGDNIPSSKFIAFHLPENEVAKTWAKNYPYVNFVFHITY